ncbi:hypothetical protein SAMN04487944_11978 [Gracilibacillus ureilyticus]|uniref:YqcI/YcgG family protein n=1 Tax=Gracilibacillus ureilyticus TaxID=531814 RepID=A0A1H9UVH5_9BACI|nr:YqcI/YcgG family protein [Gracilibacillus ureilyticus]SES13339.1 hypothetical protein SAMN04487944_11978 [Gracilibacillus ureilyticus]
MSTLYKDSPADRNNLNDWQKTVLQKFETKMIDKTSLFPCIPATIGFSTNQLRYGFIGDPGKQSTISDLAKLLKKYTEKSKDFGPYTSLIVFYQLPEEAKRIYTVEKYEQLFWQQLSLLTYLDEKKWPGSIPIEPHLPIWEYCFHGERYFMYCATPAHKNRQSRNFETMMLAITPRWVLENFNKADIPAAKIKKRVRERIKNYDSIEIHPDLNTYGEEDNYEWKQYFLRDDKTRLAKCPFHHIFQGEDIKRQLPFDKFQESDIR